MVYNVCIMFVPSLNALICECQWLAPGLCFFPGTLVSSTNKTDRHHITEILMKVALNTINPKNQTLICENVYQVFKYSSLLDRQTWSDAKLLQVNNAIDIQ